MRISLQRWLFVFLALLCFMLFSGSWFDVQLAFAVLMSLAAIMPLSYFNDLQESRPLLLLTFLLGLWAIREHRNGWYMVILAVVPSTTKTMLFLPSFTSSTFQRTPWRRLYV